MAAGDRAAPRADPRVRLERVLRTHRDRADRRVGHPVPPDDGVLHPVRASRDLWNLLAFAALMSARSRFDARRFRGTDIPYAGRSPVRRPRRSTAAPP